MNRILITGKNCEISREAFARAARLGRAINSGTEPVSAAGGPRVPKLERTALTQNPSFVCRHAPVSPQPRHGGNLDQRLCMDLLVLAGIAVAVTSLMLLAALPV